MRTIIQVHPKDNVAVVTCSELLKGTVLTEEEVGTEISVRETISFGHKIALRPIPKGAKILKYGFPIGVAAEDICPGQWVHTHNTETGLKSHLEYQYEKDRNLVTAGRSERTFMGYARQDERVGVRNELWILPMVSCVNHTGHMIVRAFEKKHPECTQVFALEQPFGCSQLGKDHADTVRILQNIALHPNAGGVLLLSLGCENNVMADFLDGLGEYDRERILPLIIQQETDEVETGVLLLEKLWENMKQDIRTPQPLSALKVGFKCGASDGFSGITANPLAGKVCELLVAAGAGTVLTEVPEMFGAEHILMNHAENETVFEKIVELIEEFKAYYESHHQPIYENPSPGNKEGGITTLEEKSLGCIQKGGSCEVTDVLAYGERIEKTGLSLLCAPGNDPVSITAMASAGCQILVFTTGRGNPLGSIVPTVKVASNSALARRKNNWIDVNAGEILAGVSISALAEQVFEQILDVANGKIQTRSEQDGYKEIGIFKNGVTL